MAKSSYFVEFLYHDLALKQQERMKYLLRRYRENKEDLLEIKSDKITEATNALTAIEQLIAEINNFKKLMPRAGELEVPEKKPQVKKVVKKKAKKVKKVKKTAKKTAKKKVDIKSLKLGLAQIRDELERM